MATAEDVEDQNYLAACSAMIAACSAIRPLDATSTDDALSECYGVVTLAIGVQRECHFSVLIEDIKPTPLLNDAPIANDAPTAKDVPGANDTPSSVFFLLRPLVHLDSEQSRICSPIGTTFG
ncbi:hypothetical protein B0A48_05424 [Cryoendolithus antarcticus]|uniref:Uncharacterized protein n=1 Tax=Cryoendolithus antarcticus TaxID=1507870 RepID=A0A1V8TIU7_9PEZI|nr:hypothetical protein B0A48_05424 [Cryoendolithus antarcticus]